jgi:hydrogenase maturation protease
MHTLVLAIGNTLLSDEGVGIHVLEYLRAHHPAPTGVEYLDGGTLSFTLAASIEEADNLIVIDAARMGAEPGAVKQFVDEEMDRFLGTSKRSVHEVGLIDLLTAARLTRRLPAHRGLVGVEPEKLDWGERPTERIARAIPQAAAMVVGLITAWHGPYIKNS